MCDKSSIPLISWRADPRDTADVPVNACPQSGFRSWDPLSFFCEGEGECKCEIAGGQFSIFGATEEKVRRRFPEILAGQEKCSRGVGDACDRESF